MLSTGDLEAIRAAQVAAMPDTCVVKSVTRTTDAFGGAGEALVTGATLPCRLAVTSGRELEIAARITDQRTVTITLPHGSAVTTGNRLVIGSQTYEIVAVLTGGAWSTALRVLAVEVQL